jgi:hypothetical protein
MGRNQLDRSRFVIGIAALSALAPLLVAGEMEPWDPPAPTMKRVDQLEPRTQLFEFPVTIDAPGSYYLMGNVVGAGGITIVASNVTIDLNGFTLAGPGAGSGIAAPATLDNVTIRNGTLRDWGGSGIYLPDVRGVTVEQVVAFNNSEYGILARDQARVIDCHARDNGRAGIRVGDDSAVRHSFASNNGPAYNESGIVVGQRSVVESSKAYSNLGNGIHVGPDSVVTDCSAALNGHGGIWADEKAKVSGAIATDNEFSGVTVLGDGVVVDSVARSNGVTGILTGSASVIRGSASSGNGYDGIEVIFGGIIEGCTARGNQRNGIVSGWSATLRHSVARENLQHGIQGYYRSNIIGNISSRNGSAVGGNGAGVLLYDDGGLIDGNLFLSNDRGIESWTGGNRIVRNAASGNGDDYGVINGSNSVGPIGPAQTATNPWANIQF